MNLPYFEFGGGLGDVIHQMYDRGYYNHLLTQHAADVALISHNPFVHEILAWHPNLDKLRVRSLGYWDMKDDAMNRKKYGIPGGREWMPDHAAKNVTVFPSPDDEENLEGFRGRIKERPYIVVAASAGEPDRTIPLAILREAIRPLREMGMAIVITGRTYERNGRREDYAGCLEDQCLIDILSVPGTLRLLEGAAGLVTCHSALNIAGWHLRIPQLLLYPASVHHRHIAKRDQWAFGIGFEECFHECWENLGDEKDNLGSLAKCEAAADFFATYILMRASAGRTA